MPESGTIFIFTHHVPMVYSEEKKEVHTMTDMTDLTLARYDDLSADEQECFRTFLDEILQNQDSPVPSANSRV